MDVVIGWGVLRNGIFLVFIFSVARAASRGDIYYHVFVLFSIFVYGGLLFYLGL
jgi:hypothetical protein